MFKKIENVLNNERGLFTPMWPVQLPLMIMILNVVSYLNWMGVFNTATVSLLS